MRCLLGLILMFALLSQPLAKSEIDNYVSNPGNIPDFHNFNTPQLEPGESDNFALDIHNRYADSIDNVVINAEIYYRADIDEGENLETIPNDERPYIGNKCWKLLPEVDKNCEKKKWNDLVVFSIDSIESNNTLFLEFSIVTKENTKEGTYFVRFSMNFDYNGTARAMQSRGHWSMELWEEATTNVTEGAPGNIDLDVLGVDGIIPDSSFGVKKPIPKWPLYVLITLTIVFAGLSVVFYLEEEGNYPELNKWLQKQRGKLNEFRLRFKYRKGS